MNIQIRHILNPVFLGSLLILMINDLVLKSVYHNWYTGKLSDVAGIIVFVLFLSLFFKDHLRQRIFLMSAISFIFWKSILSTPLIEFWNYTFSLNYQLHRVVDYTDLFCLLVLIPLFYYQPKQKEFSFNKKLIVYPLSILTLYTIFATSYKKGFGGNEIYIQDFVKLKMSREDLIIQLNKDGIQFTQDSIYVFAKDTFDRFVLNNIILKSDTVYSLEIGVRAKRRKTEIYIHKIKLSKDDSEGYFAFSYDEYKDFIKSYKVEVKEYFLK